MNKIGILIAIALATLIAVSAVIALNQTSDNEIRTQETIDSTIGD